MDYKQLIKNNKQFIVDYVSRHWLKLIIIIVIVVVVYFYFSSIYRRIPKYINKLDPYITEMDIHPVSACPKLIDNGYRLCDFYVASSYRAFIPCTQYYDYASIDMIIKSIKAGSRYIELDIYNKGFCYETVPVVCTGKEQGNWHWTNEIPFEDCCKIISSYAFSGGLKNGSDPFFLTLNLYTGDNERVSEKIADNIRSHLSVYLLGSDFSYQNSNIAQVPLKYLLNKLVIFCNKREKGTKLAELINYTWIQPFMRNHSNIEIDDLYEPQELTDFNRKSLTRVFPVNINRYNNNYNPRISWIYGCQFVSMNYSEIDDNMIIYLSKFKKCSFVLKPYKLRFHPTTYKKPKLQTKHVSFAPEQVSSPSYSITY